MSQTAKLKASDRQTLMQKLTTSLRKRYGKKLPKSDRPVLDTLLYAACLEETDDEAAQEGLQSLLAAFNDLNEIRVSSIAEIELHLKALPEPEWRALRIRDVLQTTFEEHFKFDLEHIKRKTQDAAAKELNHFRHASPFMKLYVSQQSLGNHVLPIDEPMLAALVVLGQVDPGTSIDQAAEEIKSGVRKADAPAFCHLLRCLTYDPKLKGSFKLTKKETEQGFDPMTGPERLDQLFKSGGRKPAKAEKSSKSKTKGTTVKKAVKKGPAKKVPVKKKSTTKKAVSKKTVKKRVARKR